MYDRLQSVCSALCEIHVMASRRTIQSREEHCPLGTFKIRSFFKQSDGHSSSVFLVMIPLSRKVVSIITGQGSDDVS